MSKTLSHGAQQTGFSLWLDPTTDGPGCAGSLSRWNSELCPGSYKQETKYLHKIHFPSTCVIASLHDETLAYFHNNQNAWRNGPEVLRTCDSADRIRKKPSRLWEEMELFYGYLFLLLLIPLLHFSTMRTKLIVVLNLKNLILKSEKNNSRMLFITCSCAKNIAKSGGIWAAWTLLWCY